MFLATTALSDFWTEDTKEKITFLGEWCTTNPRYDDFENKTIFDFQWKSQIDIKNASLYSQQVNNEILSILTDFLNNFHCVNENKRYWEIILGNWLQVFIDFVYDRYITLKRFIAINPNFTTTVLSKDSFVTPIEYKDFINHIISDSYNLQLYSQILNFLGYDHEEKVCNRNIQTSCFNSLNSSSAFGIFLNIILYLKNCDIVLSTPYFNNHRSSILKLFCNSKFGISLDNFSETFSLNININKAQREKISSIERENSDEFVNLILFLLDVNLPALFFEAYSEFNNIVFARKRKVAKLYVTASAIHSNYIYKFWIAKNREKITLAIIQHGGGYGIFENIPPEIYERRVADYFLTWGWGEDAKTIPLTHEKLNAKIVRKKSDNILFVLNDNTKYMRLQFSNICSSIKTNYIPDIIKFISMCKYKDNILIRPYSTDYGFDIAGKIKSNFPNIKIFHDSSFEEQAAKCKIAIFDNMYTGYLQTLSLNIPTLIFVDKNYYLFRNEKFANLLINAKILFLNPTDAASHLNSIYNDVDSWWNSNIVQDARACFCNEYARLSTNWAKEWVQTFNKIIESEDNAKA